MFCNYFFVLFIALENQIKNVIDVSCLHEWYSKLFAPCWFLLIFSSLLRAFKSLSVCVKLYIYLGLVYIMVMQQTLRVVSRNGLIHPPESVCLQFSFSDFFPFLLLQASQRPFHASGNHDAL